MSVPSYNGFKLDFDPYTQDKCYMCGKVRDPNEFINAYFRDLDQEYVEYHEYAIFSACKDMNCQFPENNINWEGRQGYNGFWSDEYIPIHGQPSDNKYPIFIPTDPNKRKNRGEFGKGIKLANN